MPSMPRKYPAPMLGIQLLGAPSMNLKACVASKRWAQNMGTSGREIRNPPRAENVRNPADRVLVLLGHEQEHKRAHQRRKQNDRENVILHKRQLSVAGCQWPVKSFERRAANFELCSLEQWDCSELVPRVSELTHA